MNFNLMRTLCTAMVGGKVNLIPSADGWTCLTFNRTCTIGYPTDADDAERDEDFRAACRAIDPATDARLEITLTLAHEVGHWMTRKVYNKPAAMRKYRQEEAECTAAEYPFLEAEFAATKWGIEWINTHPDVVRQFETEWAKV